MKKALKKSIAALMIVALLLPVTLTTAFAAEIPNPYSGGYSNCTWTAWQIAHDRLGICLPRMGNAGEWAGSAAGMGYSVGGTPAPNSILVLSGHVAFVTDVSGNNIYICEGGYNGGYHEGWVCTSSGAIYGQGIIGYIYLDGVPQDCEPIGFNGQTAGTSAAHQAARKLKLEQLRAQKHSVEEKIADLTAEIQELERKHVELEATMSNRSRSLYEMGGDSIWSILFSGEGSFFDKFSQMMVFFDNDAKLAREYDQNISQIQVKVNELQKENAKLEDELNVE